MGNAAQRRRARRIADHTKLETGWELFQAMRRASELEARLRPVLEVKRMTRAEIKKWLRSEGLDPRDMIELADIIAPAFPAALERRRARVATGGKALPPSETERFAKEFLKGAKRRPKPRVVVISPRTVARVVEAIYKRHPEIRDWLAERGLTVEDGTNLLFRVLDYTAPRDKAAFLRRVDRRGGVLWEMLLPFEPAAVRAERRVGRRNAIDWVLSEPERFGAKRGNAAKLAAEVGARFDAATATPAGFGRGIVQSEGNPGFGEVDVLGENLWMVRFTEIRDQSGRLIMDHMRGLVSYTPNGIDITPVGVGESKFGSKAAELMAQTLTNIFRAKETFRAANLPDPSVLPVTVRWGKALAVIAQSEAPRGVNPQADFASRVSKAAGKKLDVEFVQAGTAQGAKRSRDIVEGFMKLLEMENLGEGQSATP